MSKITNITNITAAIDLLISFFDRGKIVSDLIKKARAEGRDVTDAELDVLSAETDQAITDARAAPAGDGGG